MSAIGSSDDERDALASVDQERARRLVEQREEQLTATDWFFSHAVRMRAAYRPDPATAGNDVVAGPGLEDEPA